MTIIILPNSTSFSGVSYNENKNELGVSELLAANNFGFSGDSFSKSDYINYMEMVSRTNGRVENVQFHAVVSAKGRENSFEELKDVAVKYLETMGYGNNPYLVYGHSDTKNNHVHLVSTRVDKQGKKIDDSYEKLRTHKFIKEVLGLDFGNRVEDVLAKVMDYNFSNKHQFKMLVESLGWKVQEHNQYLELIKGGYVQHKLLNEDLESKISKFQVDNNRKQQLSALLYKYKVGLDHNELKKLMRQKFGVELVFHTGEGHTKPYGFTAIDHSFKSIYKGSELIDIKKLLISPERQKKVNECKTIIDLILSNKHNVNSFGQELDGYGYKFYLNGNISLKGEKNALLMLDAKSIKELRYNTRLEKARLFNVTNSEEVSVISKVFFVKADDLQIVDNHTVAPDLNYYSDMMRSFLGNELDIAQKIKDKELMFARRGGVLYLIDPVNNRIFSSDDLGISFLKQRSIEIMNIDSFSSKSTVEYDFILSGVISFLEVLDQNYNSPEEYKRKRRNKNNRKT